MYLKFLSSFSTVNISGKPVYLIFKYKVFSSYIKKNINEKRERKIPIEEKVKDLIET